MTKEKKTPKEVDFKVIPFGHLGYKVYFRDMQYLDMDVPDVGGVAFTCTVDKHSSYVFFRDIETFVNKPHNIPLAAHEITHVLQNICRDRMISFDDEREHMAYIMSYLLNELFGYDYILA